MNRGEGKGERACLLGRGEGNENYCIVAPRTIDPAPLKRQLDKTQLQDLQKALDGGEKNGRPGLVRS